MGSTSDTFRPDSHWIPFADRIYNLDQEKLTDLPEQITHLIPPNSLSQFPRRSFLSCEKSFLRGCSIVESKAPIKVTMLLAPVQLDDFTTPARNGSHGSESPLPHVVPAQQSPTDVVADESPGRCQSKKRYQLECFGSTCDVPVYRGDSDHDSVNLLHQSYHYPKAHNAMSIAPLEDPLSIRTYSAHNSVSSHPPRNQSVLASGSLQFTSGVRSCSIGNGVARKATHTRVAAACGYCRSKKIRCCGIKPQCSQYARQQQLCVNATDEPNDNGGILRRQKHKAVTLQHVNSMTLRTKENISIASTYDNLVGKGPSLLSNNSNGIIGALNMSRQKDTEYHSDSFPREQNACHVLRLIEAQLSPCSSFSASKQVQQEIMNSLPSLELQEHLAEIFFDKIYAPSYLLLHKPTFLRDLRGRNCPPTLIFAICAIASRFDISSDHDSLSEPFLRGEEWACIARHICTKEYAQPNIATLTSLVLLCLHEFGACNGERSWALGGQAIHMAFFLQLHKDLGYDVGRPHTPLTNTEREVRRRLMWACFLLDRFMSSGSERPAFIDANCLHIPLPVREELFQSGISAQTEMLNAGTSEAGVSREGIPALIKDNMGIPAYFIRAVAIWGNITAYMSQDGDNDEFDLPWSSASGFAKLNRRLIDFQNELPSELRYTEEAQSKFFTTSAAKEFLLLHLAIQHNTLTLHRLAVTKFQKFGNFQLARAMLQRSCGDALYAASNISGILRQAKNNACQLYSPFSAYCAYSATNIQIIGIILGSCGAANIYHENVTLNIQFIKRMGSYWGVFRWMADTIERQHSKVLNRGQMETTAWQVLGYGDWFSEFP